MRSQALVLAAFLVLAGLTVTGVVADDGSTYEGWAHQLHDCQRDWGSDDPGAPSASGHDLVSLDVREGPIPNATGTGIGVRLTMEGGFEGEPAENETLAALVNLTIRSQDGPENASVVFATREDRPFEARSSRTWPDQVVGRTNVSPDRFYVAAWFNHHRFGATDGDTIVADRTVSYHVDGEGDLHARDLLPGGYVDPETGSRVQGCTDTTETQRYRDDDGYTVRETPGPPPVANFTVDPDEPEVGEEIRFTDRSTDPNDTVESRNWTFGDGNRSTGEAPTHVYDEPGYYRVTLVVTDAEGNRNATQEVLQVQPAGPVASFVGGPEDPHAGETVYLNSTSYDDDGNLSHQWTLGDGTKVTGRNVTHVYEEAGTYNVTLNVTDEEGRSDEATATARIHPPGNATDGEDGAEGRTDGRGNGTGSRGGGTDATDGTGDRDGDGTGSGNRPPVARIEAPTRVQVGETVTFRSRATDPDDGSVAHRWNFDDGSARRRAVVNHTYGSPGRYNVTLLVADDDQARDRAHHVVVVGSPSDADAGNGSTPGDASNRTGPEAGAGENTSRRGRDQSADGARPTPTPAAGLAAVIAGSAAAAVAARR